MSVKLRLRRIGKKKQPFYRIVATDSRVARDGKYIEKVGHYNPVGNPPEIVIDDEKALLWLSRGAIPTDTVKNLFSQQGIMLRHHLLKQGMDAAKVEEEVKKWELLQTEREKRKEALKAQQEREAQKAAKEAEKAEKAAEAAAAKEAEVSEATEASNENGNSESSEPEAAQPEPTPEGSDESPKEA